MSNPLISIVIPVYNVEKFLDRCMRSVLAQTYTNLEVILVDDGSLDDSGKMCDEYAERDKRVRVVHKSNGGLSDARNVGIAVCRAEYIAFIDSDDFVSVRFIEKLYGAMATGKTDIAMCHKKIFFSTDELNESEESKKLKIMSKEAVFDCFFDKHDQFVPAWNKLYKRSLFDSILFPEGKVNEDSFTTYRLFALCDKIAVIEDELYFYYQNPNGIMHSKIKNSRTDDLEAHISSFRFFEENGYGKAANDNAWWLLNFFVRILSLKKDEFENYYDFMHHIKREYKPVRKMLLTYGKLRADWNVILFLSKGNVRLLSLHRKFLDSLYRLTKRK